MTISRALLMIQAALLVPAVATPQFAAAAAPSVVEQKAKATPAPAAPEQKAQTPPAPAAIPVPEIVRRAEEVTKLLRGFEALAVPGPVIDAIQARLPVLSAQLGGELQSTIETLKHEPARTVADRLAQSWRANRAELNANVEVLTKRATQLEDELNQLGNLRATWTQTRTDARDSRAPTAVVLRVNAVLADIEATRAVLQAQRTATLVLQDQVAVEVARCQDALARIERFLQTSLTRTFVRDTLPIWSPELGGRHFADLPAATGEAAADIGVVLRRFSSDYAVRLLLHGILFIALVLMARAAREWAQSPAAHEDALPAAALFERPYSAAIVAALAAIVWIYPERPRLVGDVATAVGLLPLLWIVRPQVRPEVAPALYGLAALILLDRFRAELAVLPLADQALLMVEMLVAIAGLTWFLHFGWLRHARAGEPGEAGRLAPRRALAILALIMCAASFAAAAYGAMRLARMLGSGLVSSAFVALALYAAVQVIDGLLGFALRVWPLQGLGMVERHRELLARRAHRVLRWIAVLTWAIVSLSNVGLLDPVVALGQSALSAELRRGSIGISFGDVLAFVLTVWVAFLVSGFIRFVLEEDVYSRLALARGVPYVISSLLHYAILFVGFIMAVSALGVDLNKVTILAGAFGVGLGFGLQGLVNNFVSGLIVLFERPIHVGDSIQLGDVAGKVRRIGIRSTTVLTPEGAEVIVPNAALVAEKVTNWNHSEQQRRLDVKVGVAYGSPPEKVIDLLKKVAISQAGVLAEPAPVALFVSFGDNALNFELRAWTKRFDRWVEIRSELGIALYAALREAGMEIPYDRGFQDPRNPQEA